MSGDKSKDTKITSDTTVVACLSLEALALLSSC
jgi:hypothetical protein